MSRSVCEAGYWIDSDRECVFCHALPTGNCRGPKPPAPKPIPRIPTPEMLAAAMAWREVDANDEIADKWLSMVDRIYRAMIAVAKEQA